MYGEVNFEDIKNLYQKVTLKNLLGVKGENNQKSFAKENLINEIKKFI